MKIFLKKVAPIACSAGLMLVVSLLPLIPVESSPVVPDPIARSTFVSIFGLFASPFLCGVRLEATWATLPVLLGLAGVAMVAGWKLGRRIAGRT